MQGAIIRGKDMPGHHRRHSAMSCTKPLNRLICIFGLWTRVGWRKHNLYRIFASCTNVPSLEDTLAQPDEYDWTVRLRPRCGLMSN